MNNWAIALLPLAGVVLGAALQYWLSRTNEKEKRIEELRSEAYADYLRAIAAAAHLQSDEDMVAAARAAADAKARIAVYGSGGVIATLARFEEKGAVLSAENSQRFIAVISAMRPSKAAVSDRDLRLVLLGPDRND